MSEVHIVAIVSPAEGKEERVASLLKGMTRDVHAKEGYTLRYMLAQPLDKSVSDLIVIETYKDEASADEHGTTEHAKEFFATLEKEQLLAKAPYLQKCKTIAGFDTDRELVA